MKKLWRWTRRIVGGLLALAVVLAIAGAGYQWMEDRRTADRFPAPGKLVDVGGHRLHLFCTGTGSPTVILDTGLGVPSLGWSLVQTETAKFTRVCSYDRAGYGWSDPGPGPRTSGQIARELQTLLSNAHIDPPYVLAGHSFGGYNIRVFRHLAPRDVVGMVMVDTSHEDQNSYQSPRMKKMQESESKQLLIGQIAVRLGVVRLFPSLAGDDDGDLWKGFPAGSKQAADALGLRTGFIDAISSELKNFETSASEVRAAGDLGDLPLVVITAGKTGQSPGMSPEDIRDFAAFHKIWTDDLQLRLARLSSRGKRVIAENSDHMIPFRQPEIVVSALQDVVSQARGH
jgi:pimeloyl-ACP methyl ester carboxylesterase